MKRLITMAIIITGILIAIVCITLIIFLNNKSGDSQSPSPIPIPTRYPVFKNKVLEKNVPYDTDEQEKLSRTLKERPALSSQGATLRQNLITMLNNESGILHETDTYRIEYIHSPDFFMTEIKSPNITGTKQSVSDYLTSIGFSQNDICYLPLIFYVNKNVAQQIKDSSVQFSPLPIGC